MNTLKKGINAPENVYLQSLLGLTVDGVFGTNTELKVKEFQAAHKLEVDGIVGPKMWAELTRVYPRTKLTETDYISAANILGCEVAAVKAIKEVESGKSPFLNSGFPTLLFEAHIFYKQLGQLQAEKLRSNHPNIISRSWNKALYKGGEKEIERLREAWLISAKAASASASYGAFQICGFNYSACGCKDSLDFLGKIWLGEKQQLETFVRFIKSSGIAPYLITKNWREVARRYNGPSYRDNKYDERLEKAYNKYKKA